MNQVTPVASTSTAPDVSTRLRFEPASQKGFGDRQNTWAWAMLWWRGKLYVGTNRAFIATERAAVNRALPWLKNLEFAKYPPEDADIDCPPDPADLPVSAEIWRWTPESDLWERVFASPVDVPIPNRPGKFVARDVGFRDMAIFTEADGTEAMYVSGVNSKYFNGPVPPPRLLRTTDGEHFAAVPQAPGTVMGTLNASTLRTIVVYKDRLFVTAGRINGNGILYEASNPAGGNDYFRQVTPEGMQVFEMALFNDQLYLGLREPKGGYAVVRTDASGTPPYKLTTIVAKGAYLPQPSLSVISMHIFQGRLYVGTDRPAEIIRINPDDSWDLVVGSPRNTPDGWKYPISGLDDGFCNWLNGHIWRMQEYEGRLYIGTMNMATPLRNVPEASEVLAHNYGFNLFVTDDGTHFTPLTLNGMGDMFAFGLRTMAKTSHGLFLGTANSWYGTQIWRGQAAPTSPPASHGAQANGNGVVEPSMPATFAEPTLHRGDKHARLEAEVVGDKALLSWERPAAANIQHYRIMRSTLGDQRRIVDRNPFVRRLLKVVRTVMPSLNQAYLPPLPKKLWIPGPYHEVGRTEETSFESSIVADERYLFYVMPVMADGSDGEISNLVSVPALAPTATFASLMSHVDGLCTRRKFAGKNTLDALQVTVVDAWSALCTGNSAQARTLLQSLQSHLEDQHLGLDTAERNDLRALLEKVCRRLRLAEEDRLPLESL